MIRPSNELLTDRHRAAARWLPTTGVEQKVNFVFIRYFTLHVSGESLLIRKYSSCCCSILYNASENWVRFLCTTPSQQCQVSYISAYGRRRNCNIRARTTRESAKTNAALQTVKLRYINTLLLERVRLKNFNGPWNEARRTILT